jgi:glycosyltransferase involved in cell wall biosynthesis
VKILWLAPYPHDPPKNTHVAPWISTLLNELSQKDNLQITVLSTSNIIKRPIIQYTENGVNFVYLKVPTFPINLLSLYKIRINIIKSYLSHHIGSYDLVHIHGSEHQYEASVYDFKIPKLISIQGILTEYLKTLPKRFSKQSIGWRVISSLYEKKYLKKIKHHCCRTEWDKSFIRKINVNAVIHHNWEMIRPEFFNYEHLCMGEKILFMGGTNWIKGYREALMVYNIIKRKYSNIKLIVLGPTNINRINNIIISKKLHYITADDIEIRGVQNSQGILNAYSEAFCLLHPSYIDNSPNSICEAQVSGLPVVASRVGGIPSLIRDQETGILTSLDPWKISDDVSYLYENIKLREKLSRNSIREARVRHDPITILENTQMIYKKVLDDI